MRHGKWGREHSMDGHQSRPPHHNLSLPLASMRRGAAGTIMNNLRAAATTFAVSQLQQSRPAEGGSAEEQEPAKKPRIDSDEAVAFAEKSLEEALLAATMPAADGLDVAVGGDDDDMEPDASARVPAEVAAAGLPADSTVGTVQ